MSLKLLENMIAVKRMNPEEQSSGGILISLGARKQPNKGVVRYAGPGKMHSIGARAPMTARVGDTVYWTSYSGIPVEEDGEELLIMAETELLALERVNEEKMEGKE